MTRKRALELAQECIEKQMTSDYPMRFTQTVTDGREHIDFTSSERYAELAAALKLIEHMARQKEMTL
jgi:hypothetical protein